MENMDKDLTVHLRENKKDFNFQLHHRLSKFEVPVVVNLKHIFELLGLYITYFLIQKLLELIRLTTVGQFWRKSQNEKGGKFELRSQLCYYNCTPIMSKRIFAVFRSSLFFYDRNFFYLSLFMSSLMLKSAKDSSHYFCIT